MIRTLTLSLGLTAFAGGLLAATGGPDTYGYIWKDSNEPDGPVYNWVDITTTGTQVTGLADDNLVGPFVMTTNMPYYWYEAKKLWIGSNGYLAFNGVNIAAPFPLIPTAGGANDFLAGMMCDLTFTGAGNPAECWYFDDPFVTIVSYIDVPFWSPTPPSWTGSNTFQVILDKTDSTITYQYQAQTGTTQSNDLTIGIESITGDIGLQHSADTYPPVNYAVRFYNPAVPLIDVIDAAVAWNTAEGSEGLTLAKDGPPFTMTLDILNTGSVNVGNFTVQGRILSSTGTQLAVDQVTVGNLIPGQDTMITFATTWDPTQAGTFTFEGSVSGIANELVSSNNVLGQEITVYDTAAAVQNIDWAGPFDDGIGLSWNGGNGGVAAYVLFPNYPAFVTGTRVRITSNTGQSGYAMMVYDDDGPDGGPGTLLDSVYVAPAQATVGDNVHALSAPITLQDSGLYVLWYMLGQNVNIAQDVQGPFSRRCFEVLDGVWADYRDRDAADFHLGVQVTLPPVFDAGTTGFFGLIDGLNVGTTTTVRTWVRNFGNQTINNFPVSYQFGNEPVVTQTYSGPAMAPGDSSLFNFATPFEPTVNGPGQMCTWVDYPGDADPINDTTCVSINITVGVDEMAVQALELVPNPAHDRVVLLGVPLGPVRLVVHDLTGRAVMDRSLTNIQERVELDLNSVASGTYQVLLQATDRTYTGKLVVDH